MCRHVALEIEIIGGARVIVLVDQLGVDDVAVVSEVTVEAVAFPGGVVADTLVCAVNLTEVAVFPSVPAVLGRDVVAIRFHRTSARIVRRRTMTFKMMVVIEGSNRICGCQLIS